jgi:hypothetical protein
MRSTTNESTQAQTDPVTLLIASLLINTTTQLPTLALAPARDALAGGHQTTNGG